MEKHTAVLRRCLLDVALCDSDGYDACTANILLGKLREYTSFEEFVRTDHGEWNEQGVMAYALQHAREDYYANEKRAWVAMGTVLEPDLSLDTIKATEDAFNLLCPKRPRGS